jgi:predicted metallopeptidase
VIREEDEQGRPIIDASLSRLAGEIARLCPELAHVDAKRILFVTGAARLMTRATIRPFAGPGKPSLVIDGAPILYEICLRPRFFLETKSEERILIIIHELWHASPAFDGTLATERRHRHATQDMIESEVSGIADRFRASGSRAGEFLAHVGELRMRAWLARPPSRIPPGSSLRRSYDERDLHLAIIDSRD